MLTVLALGLNEAFSCWDSLLELSCVYTKLSRLQFLELNKIDNFPAVPAVWRQAVLWVILRTIGWSLLCPIAGKITKMLRKWKRKCSNLARTLKKCPINRNSAQKLLPSPLRFSNVYILPKNWPRFWVRNAKRSKHF